MGVVLLVYFTQELIIIEAMARKVLAISCMLPQEKECALA
jgi:hypothetical protein